MSVHEVHRSAASLASSGAASHSVPVPPHTPQWSTVEEPPGVPSQDTHVRLSPGYTARRVIAESIQNHCTGFYAVHRFEIIL